MIESKQIAYVSGFKHQLRGDVWIKTTIRPPEDIHTDLVSLYATGWLHVRKYFAWDGASGPAIDTQTNMRGSLAHDAIYYLMRIGKLDRGWKQNADALLRRCMIEDGAWPFRADYYYWAVKHFAHWATKNERAPRYAPKEVRPSTDATGAMLR
jgi:hypothetical protein